jgi:subtilisin family serine protease
MPQTTPTYYYAGGKKVLLDRRDDRVALKLRDADSSDAARTRGLRGLDLPAFEPPADADIWPGGELVVTQTSGLARSAGERSAQLRSLNDRGDVEYASPVYEHTPGDQWIGTNQVVARFDDAMSEFEVRSLGDYYGLEIVERADWLSNAFLLQLTPAATLDALSLANELVEQAYAAWAHPNFLRKLAQRGPALELVPALADRYWHLKAIDAFAAWEITVGSSEIVVAIVDDGVDVDHQAFQNQASSHFNVITMSGNPRPPADKIEYYAHGTACAGLALGAPNGSVDTSGVAPGCRLMAVRLLDRVIPPSTQQAVLTLPGPDSLNLARALSVVQPFREGKAIHWAAANGAHVISNSWGPPDGKAALGIPQPLDDYARLAVEYAAEKGRDGKGCVICWAAGNGNESVSWDGYASHPEVLAVAACTADGQRAPYSDYGPEVRICAPGGGLKDGLLTTVAADPAGHAAYRHDFNGTSAATPIVAGVAALLLSRYPDLARQEVYDILCATADRIDPAGGQYDADGHSPYYGYGRVNARKALEEAARRHP